MPTAYVGSDVHYVCPETKEHRAAKVSEITGNTITLHVFRPPSSPHFAVEGPLYVATDVHYCPDKTPKTWHWPEHS